MSLVKHIDSVVSNGVEFLNQRFPGWLETIDLQKLDIQSIDNCIIGQLNTWEPILDEDIEVGMLGLGVEPLICILYQSSHKEYYGLLNERWTAVITELRQPLTAL